jgi:hypothetical protein
MRSVRPAVKIPVGVIDPRRARVGDEVEKALAEEKEVKTLKLFQFGWMVLF